MKTHFHRPCLKYLKERKVKDNKVYFYASQNASDQFKTKDVSTLIIVKTIQFLLISTTMFI